jgi:hypothetical protein
MEQAKSARPDDAVGLTIVFFVAGVIPGANTDG